MTKGRKNCLDRYGPWAVVTGASEGIGSEIARELARRGLNLVLSARNEHRLRNLSSELVERYGIDTRTVVADLGTHNGTQSLIDASKDLEVGLFVANAGFGTSGCFLDSDIETELSMIDLNTRFLAAQTHYFGNRLRQRGHGGIILLSSIVSWQGVPKAANYAATKAYVQSLAEALGRELRTDGVDVLSSAPAQVDTGFMARANMRSEGTDAAIVAVNTLDALGKKTTVYPHFKSWFLSTALAMLPRRIRVRILEGVMAGMTQHQVRNPVTAVKDQ